MLTLEDATYTCRGTRSESLQVAGATDVRGIVWAYRLTCWVDAAVAKDEARLAKLIEWLRADGSVTAVLCDAQRRPLPKATPMRVAVGDVQLQPLEVELPPQPAGRELRVEAGVPLLADAEWLAFSLDIDSADRAGVGPVATGDGTAGLVSFRGWDPVVQSKFQWEPSLETLMSGAAKVGKVAWSRERGWDSGYENVCASAEFPLRLKNEALDTTTQYPWSLRLFRLRMHGSALSQFGAKVEGETTDFRGTHWSAFYEPWNEDNDHWFGQVRFEAGGYTGNAGWFPTAHPTFEGRAFLEVTYNDELPVAFGLPGGNGWHVRLYGRASTNLWSGTRLGLTGGTYYLEAKVFNRLNDDMQFYVRAETGSRDPYAAADPPGKWRVSSGVETGF